ncbi:J domain-containing protein [Paenibacillus soyae]|uniref:J domain-containing protein n=1 Tax=Paenibacillus soyae TaxID=2969249 RepID=A0A9X2SAM7_9BACL|nr:J domain-containing protein [Paenibacillus soyae]MCR2806481.1 J domain-containing protein [Paenibacillus soyae]
MEDLKQAYKTMGLEENAPKDEVEKRYTTLMKRERSRAKSGGPDDAAEESDFAKVTEAYRFILAQEDKKFTEAFNEQEYGKYKNMAGQAQKLDHFWRYYKVHTFGAIAVIALIIYGIVSYIDHKEHERYLASLPPVDLEVTYMGLFMEQEGSDIKAVNEKMLQTFTDWKRVESSIIFVPQEDGNQYAYLQKAVVTVMSEKPDIYVMDKFMFEWMGGQGALKKLEDIPELAEAAAGDKAMKHQTEDDPAPVVYGIDLTDTKLFDDLPLMKKEMVVGIRVDAPHPENAVKFIQEYLASTPE